MPLCLRLYHLLYHHLRLTLHRPDIHILDPIIRNHNLHLALDLKSSLKTFLNECLLIHTHHIRYILHLQLYHLPRIMSSYHRRVVSLNQMGFITRRHFHLFLLHLFRRLNRRSCLIDPLMRLLNLRRREDLCRLMYLLEDHLRLRRNCHLGNLV